MHLPGETWTPADGCFYGRSLKFTSIEIITNRSTVSHTGANSPVITTLVNCETTARTMNQTWIWNMHTGTRHMIACMCTRVALYYRDNGVVIGERLAGKRSLHVRRGGSTRLCDAKKQERKNVSWAGGRRLHSKGACACQNFPCGPKKYNVEANDAQRFLNYPTWTSASGLLEISCQTKSAVNAGLVLVFDKCQNSLELEILKQLDLFCHVDVLFFRLIV